MRARLDKWTCWIVNAACVGAIVWLLFLMLGCSSGSSSTITPAKSLANDESLRVTAPARKSWKVTITAPGGYDAGSEFKRFDEGENK
jgi:hypothetical protein